MVYLLDFSYVGGLCDGNSLTPCNQAGNPLIAYFAICEKIYIFLDLNFFLVSFFEFLSF